MRQFKILALRHNVTEWLKLESTTHYGALCLAEYLAIRDSYTLIGDVVLA